MPPKKKRVVESSSDEEDMKSKTAAPSVEESDSEEELPTKKKVAAKSKAAAKKQSPKKKVVEQSSDEESDDQREVVKSSESEEDEEETKPPPKKTAKTAAVKKTKPTKQSKKPVKKSAASQKKTPSPVLEEEEEEEELPKSSGRSAKTSTARKEEESEEEEEKSSQKEKVKSTQVKITYEEDFMLESTPKTAPSVSQAQSDPDKPKSRLMIPRMVLENFKSYAGVQDIGPFHKCFSSVVGPNGSGKSNVIDAMLFVFGKRAKQLRHNKVSELIHRSEKHPNLSYCKVSVHFQMIIDKDGDEYDIVPGSEFVVTRTGFDNNSSKYHINDKAAKWEEVSLLLRSNGIDLDHNRFLILQGEVEQIAMMKPKAQTPHDEGMLEYLEDIIGTSKYVPLIQEQESHLETAEGERNERLSRLKHAEKEVEGLESSKIEAEEFLKREREVIDKKFVLYQLRRQTAEEETAKVVSERNAVQAKLDAEKEKASKGMEELEEIEKQMKKARAQYEKVQKEMLDAKAEFAVYERKDIKYREEIKHLKGREKKITDTIAAENKKINEKTHGLQRNRDDIERFEAEKVKLTKESEKASKALDAIYASLQSETAEFQRELEERQTELAPYSTKYNEISAEFNLKKAELDLLVEKASAGKKKLENVQAKISDLEASGPKREAELKEIKETVKQNKVELPKAIKELEQVVAQEKVLTEETRDLRGRLEENRRLTQESSKNNRLVNSVMEASRSGKLKGVHGRLGDLGTISSRYDVAISTCCPGLNNIVVEKTEDGEKCLEFLRQNNLGVATFLILDKMERLSRKARDPFSCPDESERIFDLVKPKDDSYINVFYHALGDTLVCQGIDVATKIGYGRGSDKKRHRVVTLEGQLIELSGAMSGGGNQVMSGGMKASLSTGMSEKDLKKLEAQYEDKAAELSRLRVRRQELDQRIDELRVNINRMETDIHKIQMDVQSYGTRIKELEDQLPGLKDEAKVDPEADKEIKGKQKKLDAMSLEVEKCRKSMRKIEEKAEAIQEEIMNVGGVRLQAQKAKADGLSEQIDLLDSNTIKANVQIKAMEKAIKNAEQSLENLEGEKLRVGEELERVRGESKEAEGEAEKVVEAYKRIETVMEKKTEEMKDMRDQVEEKRKGVDKFRALEVDLTVQIDNLDKVVKKAQGESQRQTQKMSELVKQKERTKIDEEDEDEPMPVLDDEQLEKYDEEEIEGEIAKMEESLSKMKPNMNAIREYRKKEKEYRDKTKELEEASLRRDQVRRAYDALRKKRLDEFMAGYGEVTRRLKEMYQMITLGGDAELELVDSCDPFSEGILFSVRPPKKSWKNISNLSGGEKTLSSLALVFALHHYRPTPLYVMDEIDAALDFKNVSIVAHYIKERTKDAQFIIISLRNYMFELANHLVGIYKTNNCTKSVTIDPNGFGGVKLVEPSGEVLDSTPKTSKEREAVTA
ncbi:structural maintenance of chromosome protein [Planoprotostelium fungivorum]|uniref:Structural maintenance of chromosomes protein n=1 Tax=Planoprotostelium fungivorum TaxID=1890364 RepID=A0A2P6NYI7_9EUKA|nr:structural maintenance of chromosome protein [Planoprotostelium fungivorum]